MNTAAAALPRRMNASATLLSLAMLAISGACLSLTFPAHAASPAPAVGVIGVPDF